MEKLRFEADNRDMMAKRAPCDVGYHLNDTDSKTPEESTPI